ncbi:hypothetical protein [Candidatus Methylomicrobium oryzae]|jgi:hypothetical protein|uniref:hypothetical protein n=1 Tax=Candidatus Methylomicrobium oryzae TaxID=2802053 RepID=UPI001920A887|nr:hypothetical protein [Methylomicrobium sp. RS1]MBL1265277.1 hypothetical protein [Methylomicrobium sp. RS1]
MNINKPINASCGVKLPDDFSLVQGGPLFQLFVRSRLSTSELGWLKRRIIFFSSLTWLPLLLLSTVSGFTLDGVQIPFLHDLETHIRFLFALPLLLMTELIVHQRLKPVVTQFIERGIVTEKIRPLFDACITSALRLRNSMLIEIALIVLVVTVGHSYFFDLMTVKVDTWYLIRTVSEVRFSAAGYWFAYVSLPVFQFFLVRWLFRFFIWGWFLWQVSRLKLYLVPTHPDHAGGLSFLAGSLAAFIPFLISQGALLSAIIGERILFEGATLLSFKQEIAIFVVLLILLVLGPLSVFAPLLARTKRQGLLTYGALASQYVVEFDKKWLLGEASQDEALIGSGDIQSLADLNNSFEIIRTMQVFPFGRETILQTVVVALLPLVPLLLTMISLEDLLKRLIGMLL